MHLVMAEWYVPGKKRGRPMEETWDQFTKDSYETIRVQESDSGGAVTYEDARELGFDMIAQYLEEYGHDPHWEIISPEQRFGALIPSLLDPTAPVAENVGTLDLVVRDLNDGSIRLVDHKNVGTIQYQHLVLDDQAGTYIALGTHVLRDMGLIGPKESIKGMEYNFLRKAKKDTRPENERGQKLNKPEKKHYIERINAEIGNDTLTKKMTLAQLEKLAGELNLVVGGEVSKNQPTKNFLRFFVPRTAKERNTQIKRIAADVEVMNMFRSGQLPLTKNPTASCPFDCDFFNLCELHESDPQGAKELIAMGFSRRDPYYDHREGAENSKAGVAADTRTKKEATHG